MTFKYSKKVTLLENDKIKVSQGPYYIAKNGNKISMAEKGVGTFIRAGEDNLGIYVKFGSKSSERYLYIGPEYKSENTGTIMRPYKITKLRK